MGLLVRQATQSRPVRRLLLTVWRERERARARERERERERARERSTDAGSSFPPTPPALSVSGFQLLVVVLVKPETR